MAGDPADVGGAEINIAFVNVENVFVRERAPEQIAGGAVHDAFRFAGRAAGVEDEQKILGAHDFRRTIGRRPRHQFMIPDIAPGDEIARFGIAPDDDDFLDAWGVLQRGIGEFLEFDVFAGAQRDVGGDEQFAFGIIDAAGQRIGAEPAEHHRMNRADAGAAKHGDGGFGNHRHVNRHAVAFFYAVQFQNVGEFTDFAMQLRVRQLNNFLLRFALPDDGRLVAARGQVAVEAVARDVELTIGKPSMFNFPRGGVPSVLASHRRFFEPRQRLRLLQPKRFRLANGALIQRVELRSIEMRAAYGGGGWGEGAAFLRQGFSGNGWVAHVVGELFRKFPKITARCQSRGTKSAKKAPAKLLQRRFHGRRRERRLGGLRLGGSNGVRRGEFIG